MASRSIESSVQVTESRGSGESIHNVLRRGLRIVESYSAVAVDDEEAVKWAAEGCSPPKF